MTQADILPENSRGLSCCGNGTFLLPSDQIVRTVYNIPAERSILYL